MSPTGKSSAKPKTTAQLKEALLRAEARLEEKEREIKTMKERAQGEIDPDEKTTDLQRQNKELSHQIQTLQADLAAKSAIDSVDIPVSKSTFRIDLYDSGAGELQGKIEYPLMKAKKAFKGLDIDAIGDFIAQYTPQALISRDVKKPPLRWKKAAKCGMLKHLKRYCQTESNPARS
jgi:hypothetical protein